MNERSGAAMDTSRGVHQLRSFAALWVQRDEFEKKMRKNKNQKLSTDSRNTPILMDQRALKGGEGKTSAITLLKFVFKWAGSCGNFSLLFKNFYYFCCNSIKAGDSMASDATDGGGDAILFKPVTFFEIAVQLA